MNLCKICVVKDVESSKLDIHGQHPILTPS